MRLLSLDFDGCLHPAPLVGAEHFVWLPVLEQLLTPHPDVSVLVHSTWRYDHSDSELRSLLGRLGDRFVGAAPRGPRYESVRWVVGQNKQIRSWLLIDDDPREFPTPAPADVLLCDPLTGVSAPAVQSRLRDWLDSEPRA